jgi:hypothetical protein
MNDKKVLVFVAFCEIVCWCTGVLVGHFGWH